MYKRAELPPAHCLSQAAAEGDADKLATLLSAVSVDKNILNEALLQATLHCSTATDHLECVETLLGKGAAVNYRAEGVTVLMKACELGQIQLVEMLLQRGANIGERGREGSVAGRLAAAPASRQGCRCECSAGSGWRVLAPMAHLPLPPHRLASCMCWAGCAGRS